MSKSVVGLLLGLLAFVAFLTSDWWMPTTVNRVIREARLTPLPASAEVQTVSGGKQGFGTNYRVVFKANPEDLYRWLGTNHARALPSGQLELSGPNEGGEGTIGQAKVTITGIGEAILTYSASL